jgi:hypothetical protein
MRLRRSSPVRERDLPKSLRCCRGSVSDALSCEQLAQRALAGNRWGPSQLEVRGIRAYSFTQEASQAWALAATYLLRWALTAAASEPSAAERPAASDARTPSAGDE